MSGNLPSDLSSQETWSQETRPQETRFQETYSPWTVVNFVFKYLVDQGLHPTLGESGHPGEPAAALLRAMGITPTPEGDARIANDVRRQLADLRAAMLEDQ